MIDRHDPYPTPVPPHVFADPAVGAGLAAALTALDRVPNGMLWSDDNDDGLDDAMRTVAASGRPLEFAAVAVLLVRRSFSRGYFEQALESARTAWADAQRLEGGDISGVLEEMVISALTANGRLQEALMMMHSALDGARETGRAAVLFRYRRLRAAVLVSQGSLDDAEAEARGVIDLPALLGYPHRVALPLAVIVESALRRGNSAEARSMFARYGLFSGNEEFFRDGAGQLGYFPDLEWAAALLAEARGDAAAAARAVAPLGAQLGAGYFVALAMHHRLAQMVRIALSAGAKSEARQLAAMVALLAVRNPHVESLAAASLHAQALVEHEPALLEQAVELAARSEDRLLEAAAARGPGPHAGGEVAHGAGGRAARGRLQLLRPDRCPP